MIERTKKGFSLVEVMLLFTVLAVVMAASIPVMSNKIRAIPRKASHGVYRCVYDEARGGVYEYLFQGSKAIYGANGRLAPGGICNFNVPSAALYKVDIYSAGAGGTKYLDVTASHDDTRRANYDMKEGINSQTSESGGPTEPLRAPTEEELGMFDNLNVVRTTYTGDAGNGGGAYFTSYLKAIESYCKGWKTVKDPVNEKYNTYKGYCDTAQKVYKEEKIKVDTYDKYCNEIYTWINGNSSTICGLSPCSSTSSCQKYISNLKTYKDMKSAYDEAKKDYDKAVADNDSAKKAAAKAKMDANKDYSNYYNQHVNIYINAITNCGLTEAAKTKRTAATYKSNNKIQGSCYDTARSCMKSNGQNCTTTKMETDAFDKYNKYKCQGYEAAGNYTKTFPSSNTERTLDRVKNIDTYIDAKSAKEWLDGGDLAVAAAAKYGDKYAMFDLDRKSSGGTPGAEGYVHTQFERFCNLHFPVVEPHGYEASSDRIYNYGGKAGVGYLMQLVYPIRYVSNSYNSGFRSAYLANLVTEGHPDAVYVATCDGTKGYMSSCSAGNSIPRSAGDGHSVYVNFNNNTERQSITTDESKIRAYNFVKKGTDSSVRPGTAGFSCKANQKLTPGCPCIGQGQYKSGDYCACSLYNWFCTSYGDSYSKGPMTILVDENDVRACSVIQEERKQEALASCKSGTECNANCPSERGLVCKMNGNTPTCVCGGGGLYGTNATTNGNCGFCGNDANLYVEGSTCKCKNGMTYQQSSHSCISPVSEVHCPSPDARPSGNTCVCTGSEGGYPKRYDEFKKICKSRCGSNMYPITVQGKGICYPYPEPYQACYNAGTYDHSQYSYIFDNGAIKCLYKPTGNITNPPTGLYYEWYNYQKVSNPQQYFKSEEYNNIFTFKNTLNSLSEMFNLEDTGVLLAINEQVVRTIDDLDDRDRDPFHDGTSGGGGGGGGSFSCASIPHCPIMERFPWIDHCFDPVLRDSRCPDSWQCRKCVAGYERSSDGCFCTEKSTITCGPSKDPVTLVSNGLSGIKQKCVCPLDTDYAGDDPFVSHSGFCNKATTEKPANDASPCANKKCYGMTTKVDNGDGTCTCECIGKYASYDKISETICSPKCHPKLIHGPKASGSDGDCICPNGEQPKGTPSGPECPTSVGGSGSQVISGDVTIRTLTSKGNDVRDYAAFHVPNFGQPGASSNGQFISSIPYGGLATGGYPAYIDVAYNLNSALTIPAFNLVSYTGYNSGHDGTISDYYSFTAKSNVPYNGGSPTNGTNTSSSNAGTITGTYARYATINAYASDSRNKQPRMKLESNLWTKTMHIGKGGGEGKHVHFQTTNLGSNCRLVVPAGGPVLDYSNPNIHFSVEEMENRLNASITCSKGNITTFSKTVKGGTYARQFQDLGKFWWRSTIQTGDSRIYGPYNDTNNKNFQWRPTSLWVKAYNLFMGGNGASYDLNSKRITRGGDGTRLVDYCIVPRGEYKRWMVEIDSDTKSEIRNLGISHNIEDAKGTYNGVQCYNPGKKVVYSNDPLAASGAMQFNAQPGGGGAIIVTW